MAGKRLNTNDVAIASALETSFGVDPAGTTPWYASEPNEIATFGGEITTVARNPISPNRQQLKGITTDFEASVDITSDLTLSEVERWASGFTLHKGDGFGPAAITAVVSAGYSGKFAELVTGAWDQVGGLVFASGFATAANNGLKRISGTSETTMSVSGVTAESAATKPAGASVHLVGYQPVANGDILLETGGVLAFKSGKAPSAVSGAAGWFAMGLAVGQWIFIGGEGQHSFPDAAKANGWWKIKALSDDKLTLDGGGSTVANSAADKTIRIFFGNRWHNVSTANSTEFVERYYRFEALYKGIGASDADGYEYIAGCAPNAWTIRLPLTDKATSQTAFVAKDAMPITASRLHSTVARSAPAQNKAFNTSTDFSRLALQNEDLSDLSTFLKEVEITITNNFSAEKVLASLGAKFMNLGTLEVKGSVQALFTDAEMVNAVRNNHTVRIRSILKNADGGILFELPSATMGGGGRDFALNETVKINLDTNCFRDDFYEDSINIQVFHYLPDAAG